MEDAVRALQEQVNTLMTQNATLEAQLLGQQNIAQRSRRTAWSDHDSVESCTSTNEKDAC